MSCFIMKTESSVAISDMEELKLYTYKRMNGCILIPYSEKWTGKRILNKFFGKDLYPADKIPAMYREAGDILGVSVHTFAKILNWCIYSVYIAPMKDIIYRLGYNHHSKINPNIVNMVNKRKEIFKSFHNDGLVNIEAFAAIFDSTKEAKEMCGKSLWKSLCANSKTRNDCLVRFTLLHPKELAVEKWKFLNTLPSTLLKLGDAGILSHKSITGDSIKRVLNKPLYKVESRELHNIQMVIDDCKNMLGNRFNDSWCLKRIIKEHDKETKRLNALKYSEELMQIAEFLPTVIKRDGYTAELVGSGKALSEFANEMHNCIASYIKRCAANKYAIYRVTGPNGATTALGIALSNEHYNQHVGVCNGSIDTDTAAFGKYVLYKARRFMEADWEKEVNLIEVAPEEEDMVDFPF